MSMPPFDKATKRAADADGRILWQPFTEAIVRARSVGSGVCLSRDESPTRVTGTLCGTHVVSHRV